MIKGWMQIGPNYETECDLKNEFVFKTQKKNFKKRNNQ